MGLHLRKSDGSYVEQDADEDGIIDQSEAANNADTVDGEHASAFADASHTHSKSDITDFSHTHSGSDITSKVSSASHADDASSLGGLSASEYSPTVRYYQNPEQSKCKRLFFDAVEACIKLDTDGSGDYDTTVIGNGKGNVDKVDGHDASDFAAASHTHSKSDITDFSHTHSGSDITSQVSSAAHADDADTLDGYDASDFATASHTHTKSDITDFSHTHTRSEISDWSHEHSIKIGNGSSTQVTLNTGDTLHIVGSSNISAAYDDSNNKVTLSVSTSGLDADTVDGKHASSFLEKSGGTLSGNITPDGDGTRSIGTSSARLANLYAVNVYTGDLGFVETECAVCGKRFEPDDEVVLKVTRVGEFMQSIPVHLECTEAFKKLKKLVG